MSGLATLWSDLKESFLPTVALADNEEPVEDTPADEEDEDEDEDDDEDDEDDEDEVPDPLDTLRAQYSETVCKSAKHHFDECVARVTAEMEEDDYESKDYKEDCVEEFFHLGECLDHHIAPVLFNKLK